MPQYITIPLSKTGKHKGKYSAIVDAVDEDLASFRWHVQLATIRLKYAMRTRNILMHREIIARMLGRELQPDETVDHIDGNGLNNRRGNLRIATHAQNSANTGMYSTNRSGFKGVSWNKKAKKWRAKINVRGEKIYLGSFDTAEEAHEAYCAAADKYNGEFSNHG